MLPDFPISPRKHRPQLRFELSSPKAWPDILQSSGFLGAPQRLSHEWVNQPRLEPVCVFLASVSVLTHTRCVRQPLECLNPRFRHSELSFSRAGLQRLSGGSTAARAMPEQGGWQPPSSAGEFAARQDEISSVNCCFKQVAPGMGCWGWQAELMPRAPS